MTLEAVVFPRRYLLGFTINGGGGRWHCDNGDFSYLATCSAPVQNLEDEDGRRASISSPAPPRRWRRKLRDKGSGKGREERRTKNEEAKESQRMVHIAVERNRRKQMNEYLAVLRSLMPPSHAQRGDQASIVGGAINYVKELQQILISLQLNKQQKQQTEDAKDHLHGLLLMTYHSSPPSSSDGQHSDGSPSTAGKWATVADVEVSIVESHANLKVVVSRRRPKQLSRLLAALQDARLSPLHLSVATADQMVVYSFTLKVEDDCPYSSVDEITAAAHEMIGRIQDEPNFPC